MDNPKSLVERCAAIEMLVLDVDGVLTDGSITYTDRGEELKSFHVRDGAGIKFWQQQGKQAAILSGRTSQTVTVRAAELGIDIVVQGASAKLAAFGQILQETATQPNQVCFVGDDLPDLAVMQNCGLAVAVADACAEVRANAHHVVRAAGGRGAVREIIELILQCQNRWHFVVDRFRNE
jgi:3-deoxy-D-manno-octulosonate 8-phosphate phosphatase (KDO 8-P phosphatase)